MEASMLSRYAPPPRKCENHNREMFDAWKENAERIKEAHEEHRGKGHLQLDPSPEDMQQAELTEGFFAYYREQVIERELATIFWEICTGRPMNYTQKHRRIFDTNGVKSGNEEKNEFQLAMDGLNNLIAFTGLIMRNTIV
jgi:hypothetical protein